MGGGGGAKKFPAAKYSKAAFQKVGSTCPQYLWHCKGIGGGGGGGGMRSTARLGEMVNFHFFRGSFLSWHSYR